MPTESAKDTRRGFMLLAITSAAAVLTLAGCSPFTSSVPEARLLDSGAYIMAPRIDVPSVKGVEGCGAQALGAVLAYHMPSDGEVSRSAAAIANELPWHDAGATPVDLLLEARHRGFDASIARGSFDELDDNIRAGRPVLVMLDSGLEVRGLLWRYPTPNVMHWGIVSGVAIDRSSVLLAAQDHRHHVAKRKDFERRWSEADNCMIVIQPSPLSLRATGAR
jgi:hypothetical protein